MKTAVITLNNQEMKIRELPSRKNRAWQRMFTERLKPALEYVAQVGKVNLPTSVEELKAAGEVDIAPLIRTGQDLAGIFLNGLDDVAELVVAYLPEEEAKGEFYLDHACDSEFLAAFEEVLNLAFPFGQLTELIGRIAQPTSPNSASANGDSGTTS
jgi:hypothetical protein